MNTDKIQLIFFGTLFIGIGVLSFFVFLPFVKVLATAGILAVVLEPFYTAVKRKIGGRKSLAAAIVVIIVTVIVLTLLFILGSNIFSESKDLYGKFSTGDSGILGTINTSLETYVHKFFPHVSIDLKSYADEVVTFIGSYTKEILTATLASIVYVLLGTISFFYFLRDGATFRNYLIAMSPLKDEHDSYIIKKMKEAINVVVKGKLMIAVLQGALVGIGFAVFGVPNATLWGSLASICAIIPGIGTSIVVLPAVAFLVLENHTGQALGLALWGVLIVGLVDNVLTTFVYGKKINMHPLIILFSVLGGIAFFGPIGFLFGPLVVTLLFVLIQMYRVIVLGTGDDQVS